MIPQKRPDVKDILKKYGSRIEGQVKTSDVQKSNYSSSYTKFKEEMVPDVNGFEKLCKSIGNVIKVNVSEKDSTKIQKNLESAHLDLEPWQVLSLSILTFVSIFLLGLLISVAVVLINGSINSFPVLFFFLMMIVGLFCFYFVNGYPERLSNKWRLKASSQMVPAVLYVVVYMRHTPNLEKAISFASEHLQYPLALDFKKIFYNVEVGKFSTIKESLDNYLETWRGYSTEFIESFHLIESSLFEPEEARRIEILEKSLQVILDGVYDKMLKFTHEVKSPITNVYMLGVVLPTLGLALLPLASAMVGDMFNFYHIFLLFNIIIPFMVYYLTDKVLIMRPGGYGESSLVERNPLYAKYKSREHYVRAFLICFPFIIIGLLPLIFGYTFIPNALGLPRDFSYSQIGMGFFGDGMFFDFKQTSSGMVGPFGVGALILGMFIPVGIALFFSIAYKNKTKDLIKERESTKELELEFNNSLFQIGSRLGNGTPPELVFGQVAESSRGLRTEDFFKKVNYNIRQMGMSLDKAIFEPNRGAINYYPSDLIATSMRVLIESSKKGLKIAAISLMSISEYVKNIQKITLRLKDMLAEIISDMKSNMTFLAPLLSGIVVGLASMITSILNSLNLNAVQQSAGSSGIGNLGTILSIFDLTKMIPPYYLQIAVGIYLVQITFILTRTLVTVDSGEDKLERINKTGLNLQKGIGLYFFTALLATVALFLLSTLVLGGMFK